MQIPGYTELGVCPKTPGCTAKRLFRNKETGELFRVDVRANRMVRHECRVLGGKIPTVVYITEWFNSRTGKTRYTGPSRILRTSLTYPSDTHSRPQEWRYRGSKTAKVDWVDVPMDSLSEEEKQAIARHIDK